MTQTRVTLNNRSNDNLKFDDLSVGEAFTWTDCDFALVKTGTCQAVVLNGDSNHEERMGNSIVLTNKPSKVCPVTRISRLEIKAIL